MLRRAPHWSRLFRSAYLKSPINFSSVTGYAYPHLPHLIGHPVWGIIPDLLRQNGMLAVLEEAGRLAMQDESGMCYYWSGTQLVVLVTQPRDIGQVLLNEDHTSREKIFSIWTDFFGKIFFSKTDDRWQRGRATFQHRVFSMKSYSTIDSKINSIVNEYVAKIDKAARANEQLDLGRLLSEYSLDLAGRVLMDCPDLSRAVLEIIKEEFINISNLWDPLNNFKWSLPEWLRQILFSNETTQTNEQARLLKDAVARAIYQPNAKHFKEGNKLINEVRLEKGYHEEITLEQILPLLITLKAIGCDSIKNTGQFIIKLLHQHPAITLRLRQELQEKIGNQPLTMQNVNKVTYLDMIIKETLRLYPTTGIIARDVTQQFTLLCNGDVKLNDKDEYHAQLRKKNRDESQDVRLCEGTVIIISPYLTHRLPDLWENPLTFDPERFSSTREQAIPKGAYLPFNLNNKVGTGKNLGMNELKLFLAHIYLKYSVELINGNDSTVSFNGTTLQPKITPKVKFTRIDDYVERYQRSRMI